MACKRRSGESGFALLMVFVMAAAIAVTLYMEIPRVAFDSQRQKELMLVERGEQYKRAIKVFVKKNNRYPAKIEELESLNNQRYLRRRYKDPITGKDEWRLIHIQNGIFTDSLVNKPKTGDDKQASANTFITEGPAIGSSQGTQAQQVNPAMRRRASEGGTPTGQVLGPDGLPVQPQVATAGIGPLPGHTGMPGVPGQNMSGQTGVPGQVMPGQQMPGQQIPGQQIPGQQMPGQQIPGQPGQVQGQPVFPGQVFPRQLQPGQIAQPAFPGQQTPFPGQVIQQNPGQPFPGQPFPGQPLPGQGSPMGQSAAGSAQPFIGGAQPYIGGSSFIGGQPANQPGYRPPGMPVNSQTGGVSPTPYPTQQGSQGVSPPFNQPGMQPGAGGQNAAMQMIQGILTSPRPGGLQASNMGMQTMQLGGGIAGVASTAEEEGILVYNDRTKYNEWEFIYDPTKDKPLPNPNAGVIGTAADKMGSNSGQPGNPGNNSGFGGNSGFGNNSGFGGNSGFGNTPSNPQPQTGGFGRRP